MDKLLTTQQAAVRLQVSRPHVVKLLKAGVMPYVFVGAHRRVYESDLETYLSKRDGQSEFYQARLNQQHTPP